MEEEKPDLIAVDGTSARIEGNETPVANVRALKGARSGRQGVGGPRTRRGKEIAAQNSTRHGILSRAPIVGDETIEEWELHLAGLRQSLGPVGHLEELLVHQLAQNRWVRSRLDRWRTEMVQHQIDGASAWSPDERRAACDGLSDDEALWSEHDAQSVLEALEALVKSDPVQQIEPRLVQGIVFALEVSTSRHTQGDFRCSDLPAGDLGDGATVGRLLQCVQEVADARTTTVEVVLADAKAEADAAAVFQAIRNEQERRQQALRVSTAYVLVEADGAKDLRYGATLEREFDRTLKQLETLQRARQGELPPPIRLEVQEQT